MTIAMITDFGLTDPYVGQIKGVLAGHAPAARLVDICHDVAPYGIAQAAFFLQASWRHFPPNTVFMAVVDPGVGGPRRVACLTKHRQIFLAPDNGLLGLLLEDHSQDGREAEPHAYDLTPEPGEGCTADASATFHGRDVFAPLAAQLALGEEPQMLGREIDAGELVRLPWVTPVQHGAGVDAHVLHVDRFGNVVLNADSEAWTDVFAGWNGPGLTLDSGMPDGEAAPVLRMVHHYEELAPGEVGLLAGSQGYLELGMNMQSAALALRLTPGKPVRIARRG
jgi:S-adenosylmethionine hydrolase